MDEEFWSYIPFNIATGYHLPLIGGHISGTGLYSGPFFVWLLAPYFWITQSQPLAIATLVSTTGVVTVFLICRLLPAIIGKKTALLSGLIYTSSTLATIYDRKYWNAFPLPVLSLLNIYILHQLKSTPKSIFLLTSLAFVLTVAFHAHMTSGVLLIFTLIYWIWYRLPRKSFFITLIIFIFFQTPLMVFELRHQFINTHALVNLFAASSAPSSHLSFSSLSEVVWIIIQTFSRLIYFPAGDIASELTLCRQFGSLRTLSPFPIQILTMILIVAGLFQLKSKNIFSIMLLSNLLLLFIYRLIAPVNSWYPGLLSEYYLLPSFISFGVLTAQLVARHFRRWPYLLTTIIIFLAVINLHTTFKLKHSDSLARKQALVNQSLSALSTAPFSLHVTGGPCRIYGYRYLFSVANREPVESYLDPQFLWLYQDRLPKDTPRTDLIIDADSGTIKLILLDEQTQTTSPYSNP